jgi:hypothetical protein
MLLKNRPRLQKTRRKQRKWRYVLADHIPSPILPLYQFTLYSSYEHELINCQAMHAAQEQKKAEEHKAAADAKGT